MKEIVGFKNYYLTTCGEVISKKTGLKMRKTLDTVGYYWIGIVRNDGVLKKIRIHRLMGVCYLDLDYDNKSQQINHKNNNKKMNYLSNLEITTNSINTNEGYAKNSYTTRNRIEIQVKNKLDGSVNVYSSLRECESKTGVSRKLIPLILSKDKPNNTDYDFEYLDFKLPYWIRDDNGIEFQSCRSCSSYHNLNEGMFRSKFNKSKGLTFEYEGKKFIKFLK